MLVLRRTKEKTYKQTNNKGEKRKSLFKRICQRKKKVSTAVLKHM